MHKLAGTLHFVIFINIHAASHIHDAAATKGKGDKTLIKMSLKNSSKYYLGLFQ